MTVQPRKPRKIVLFGNGQMASFAHAVLDARSRNLITAVRAVELMRGQIAEEDLPVQSDDEIVP